MKKTVSVILTLLMLFVLALPCFAAGSVSFSISTVSDNDSELVVSVNYDGGSSFQNIDFEMDYNSEKLRPTEAYEGDGLTEFVLSTKKSGGNAISMINKDSNPIKGVMATTSPFKPVKGKDLFIVKFQKLSEDSVSDGDLSLKFTNCQLDYENLKTEIKTPWSGGSSSDKENPDSSGQDSEDASAGSESLTETQSGSASEADRKEISESAVSQVQNKDADKTAGEKNVKKAVIISAVVVCVLLVAAAIIFMKKKQENKRES